MEETNRVVQPPDSPARARYDGLDVFRSLSIYGVVVIHFSLGLGLRSTPGLELVIRLRDCSFPIIVLTSYFVMTRSLMARPDRRFGHFAAGRFTRLAVPCLIWTALYWVMCEVAEPLWSGASPSWPPLTVWLTGFVHLWFLQFLFLGCGGGVSRHPLHRPASAAELGVRGRLRGGGRGLRTLGAPAPHRARAGGVVQPTPTTSLRLAAAKGVVWAKFIPVGVAMAFLADSIDALYRRPVFRAATLVAAAAAMFLHVSSAAPEVSRSLYSLAVFVVLLRPWPPGALDWLRPAAKYSYPVYIIHPAVAQAVLARLRAGTGALVAADAAAGQRGRLRAERRRGRGPAKAVPADWFLPLVPVGKVRARDRMR